MEESQERIIVLGLLGQFPMAGMAWQLIHHLVGLQRLGFAVYYIEDTGTVPYNPQSRSSATDCLASVRFIADTMSRIGLAEAWAYRNVLDGQWYGLPANKVQDLFHDAACVLNLCGASHPSQLTFRPRGRLVYLETDPVLNQVRLATGDAATVAFLTDHDAHVTYGANLGEADCPIPLSHFAWKKTRPPVILDFWSSSVQPTRPQFSTITTWQNRGKDLSFAGEVYLWSKHQTFLAFRDLPIRASQPLELATDLEEGEERTSLIRHGWFLRDVTTVSHDSEVYRDYICSSRGEFTVSKEVVARTKSGWFSDRSVCYLAAGRPVVTQETGFSKFVPTGRGLFAFSTKDEACAALEEINRDYALHSRTARDIAYGYFEATKLLGTMLHDVGVT
jgi:hypothetical protein